jgi:hypothetical protein
MTPSSHSTRNWIATTISVIALFVSIVAAAPAVYALVRDHRERDDVARRYVGALVATNVQDVDVAVGAAEPASAAADYANGIGAIVQSYNDNSEAVPAKAGTIAAEDGGYRLCFAAFSAFSSHRCFTFANFEYNEHQRITRFTVDDLAVESIIATSDYDHSLTDDANKDWRAYRTFVLTDSERAEKIEVLWLDRDLDGSSDEAPMRLTVGDAQDLHENVVQPVVEMLPIDLPKRGVVLGLIRVPVDTSYLVVCGDGPVVNPVARCHWLYRL